jgi:hypothetical protein
MSSSNGFTVDQSNHRSRGCGGRGQCGNWSGLNIAAMVLGFLFFWPIGVFLLFWIVSGRNVKDLPQAIGHLGSKMTNYWNDDGFSNNHHSDNVVFNEYQQTQYDRIRELKEEIKARACRFKDFRAKAKRRADEEEFNRFMSDSPGQADG